MKKEGNTPHVFNSVGELQRALGLPAPLHPLISLVNYADVTADTSELSKALIMNMYKISFKFNFSGQIKYGQQYYDFDNGGMSFFSPLQVITPIEGDADYSGFSMHIHADFLRGYPLGKNIRNFGFFSYAANEALCLSEKEKEIVSSIFKTIGHELSQSIDTFSQDIMISQIEQLLNYSNRFYNRQFITRKAANNDLLTKLEEILAEYFDTEKALVSGVPTVNYMADRLNVSPRYLTDMLRMHTGQSTQQHIHNKLIEKAKEILSSSNLTIAEIAYQLGFEHPQSFNKVFKRKTNVSPVEFRQSFN